MKPYVAPAWLPGGHAQTIFAALRRTPRIAFERERWETPDGDFIDLDWAGPRDSVRRLVLFHGLEGSSASHYARAIAGRVPGVGAERRFIVTVVPDMTDAGIELVVPGRPVRSGSMRLRSDQYRRSTDTIDSSDLRD